MFPDKNVTARYNGNIAEADWRSVETIGVNPSTTPKRYGYVYDALNRLSAGYYQNPDNPYSKENTESLDYDVNGNITDLYRTSIVEYGNTTATLIDKLKYDYNGNQATNINDYSSNQTGYEGGGQLIRYDLNGNMTEMPDKGMDVVKYNYLNLPNFLHLNRGGVEDITINTRYRADGTKLKKENTTSITGFSGSTTSKTTVDYLDGFQYSKTESPNTGGGGDPEMFSARAMQPQTFSPEQSGSAKTAAKTADLQFLPTSEGFYDYQNDQYIYQYKDHLGNVRVSFARNSAGALQLKDNNDYYPFGMNHLKTGNSYFGAGSYVKYKFGGKELQETGMYDFGARIYMADIGRWFATDPMAEANPELSVYRYGFNNPIMFTDPNGMLEDAVLEKIWNIGGEWKNNGNGGFDYGKHTVDYSGNYSFNSIDVDIEEVIMKGKGNKETWNNSLNFGYNSNLMMSKITGALGNWNLDMRRSFYYNEVARTGADKIERNFYLMFGGALAAPFAGAYIATLGGETAAGYLEGALTRGVTDMVLQQTIKGSIDWKQTGINAFIGGGSGAGAVQVNWLNYGGNMVNNFGTSIYDGTFKHDFTMNSMKALTGIFGMGVANYNGLTNGYLSGYFGTTLFPGLYFNTTDVVIEQNKNKK